jgi:hypothetical protein
MNIIKRKFENVKTKIRENRPQIVAVVSTAATIVLAIALVDSKKKLAAVNDATVYLASGDCMFDALKNGDRFFWNRENGPNIDLGYCPDVVCDDHDLHSRSIKD